MSLENRYKNAFVNLVFKDNILLTLSYLRGMPLTKTVDWENVENPFVYTLTLQPEQTFAFHQDVLPDFQKNQLVTTNAHFTYNEGFKSDGYLAGDGVCHLASLLAWVSADAHLLVKAPTNHDFANIPEIPKEFGVAIFNDGKHGYVNQLENLYITNNQKNPVQFVFKYDGTVLQVAVVRSNQQALPPLSFS